MPAKFMNFLQLATLNIKLVETKTIALQTTFTLNYSVTTFVICDLIKWQPFKKYY